MMGIAMVISISRKDTVRNHLNYGWMDHVNILKEKRAMPVLFVCFTLKRYAFVTLSAI